MSVTFELQIRFIGQQSQARDLKRRVLKWLRPIENLQFVESLIDGIHDSLGDEPEQEVLSDDLQVAHRQAFEEDDTAPIAIYDAEEQNLLKLSEQIVRLFPGGIELSRTALLDESWSQAWDEDTAVIRTERFMVLPPGSNAMEPAVLPLFIQPGEAFGSGRHATTKVALEMLEKLYMGANLEENIGAASTESSPISTHLAHGPHRFYKAPLGRMLDVGTGSAILLIAAACLGFTDLVGTEIDQKVLDEAQANLTANRVFARLLLTPKPPLELGPFDLVAANILAPVLHDLMPTFAASLVENGVLLLAGFVAKEESGIIQTAESNGLHVFIRGECRGWIGLGLRR